MLLKKKNGRRTAPIAAANHKGIILTEHHWGFGAFDLIIVENYDEAKTNTKNLYRKNATERENG